MPLTDEQSAFVSKLTVAKLKDELKRRGLAAAGLKAELVARLTAALEQENAQASGSNDKQEEAEVQASSEQEQSNQDQQNVEAETKTDDDKQVQEATEDTRAMDQQEGARTANETAHAEMNQKAAANREAPAVKPTEHHDHEEQVDYGTDSPRHDSEAEAAHVQDAKDEPSGPAQEDEPTSAKSHDDDRKEPRSPQSEHKPDRRQASPEPNEARQSEDEKVHRDDSERANKRKPIVFEAKSKEPSKEPVQTPSTKAEPAKKAAAVAAPDSRADTRPVPRGPGRNQPKPVPSEPSGTPSNCILITNLVRPLTENGLRELLGETGTVLDLWMPMIKTHAYVIMETQEQAVATATALQGKVWPQGSSKQLAVAYLSQVDAEDGIKSGRDPTYVPRSKAGAAEVPRSGSKDRDVDLRTSLRRGDSARSEGVARAGSKGLEDTHMEVDESAGVAQKQPGNATGKRGRTPEVSDHDDDRRAEEERPSKRVHRDSKDGADGMKGISRGKSPAASDAKAEDAVLSLDQLFKKTAAKPPLYWLPLTDEEVAAKKVRESREQSQGDRGGPHDGPRTNGGGLPPAHERRVPLAYRYPHLSGRGAPAPPPHYYRR